MSSRTMRIVFWSLLAVVIGMGVVLVVSQLRARDRVRGLADQVDLDSPGTDAETITFDVANDDTGAITQVQRQVALPADANARARALLDHLLIEYAAPGSAHALPPGLMVSHVWLLPLPITGHELDAEAPVSPDGHVQTLPVAPTDAATALQPKTPGGELAVIDLRSNFVNTHPSGVEVETLTVASIVGTLHENLPQIEQIRFLVDGEPRETLAGHADLLRTYPSRDTVSQAAAAQ